MGISRRTLALLAEVIDDRFSHAVMDGLVFEYSVETSDPGGSVRKRAVAFVRNLEAQRNERDLTEAIQEIVPRLNLAAQNPIHVRLIESLRIDGLELSGGNLVPTTPTPVDGRTNFKARTGTRE
jgi:hypothetical protein